MFKQIIVFIAGFFFFGSVSFAAVAPAGFNTGTVPVATQSAADLQTGIANAFGQVLIKISGNSRIATMPEIQKQLGLVDRYVQKYSYSGNNLVVTFDQRALINLLVKAQQPVWVSERPATLIGLSINGQPPLTLSTPDTAPAIVLLQDSANQRGIPLVFPGPENQNGPWDDASALEKIAEGYHTPVVLSGNLKLDPVNASNYLADWLLVWRGQTWQWHDSGTQEAIIKSAVDKLADTLAGQLSIHLDQQTGNTFWLAVLGVTQLADYQNVIQAIKQLHPVLGVYVQDVGSHGILLQITAAGENSSALKQSLTDSQRFTLTSDAPASANAAELLTYQWHAS